MQYLDESFVELTSGFVGSRHTTPSERDRDDSRMQHFGSGYYNNHGASSYDRYYRPRLQVFNKTDEDEQRLYIAGAFTHILPLATSRYEWEETGLSQTFNGRVVRRTANFELLRYWYKVCCTQHIVDTNPGFHGRKPLGQPDCRPKPLPNIPHFRLIDVESRSVVQIDPNQKLVYAALSYVWGNAKRLLLCSDNLDRLSTPDVLIDENEDVPKTFIDALEVAERFDIPYLWIDALCILQDNADQLLSHMNCMDSIYSSATLTIVSDAESADTGIPGISLPRSPPQATFRHGGKDFLSSKRTFGTALKDSYWESRAWCLQEKFFSKRLLIFTPSQTFYHCTSATWFEDTILENKERDVGNVYIAERSDPSRKKQIDGEPSYTAYEAHRSLFSSRNFWSLVEIYSKRQLSFESDSIRAFSGILKSIKDEYGAAIWGVPEYNFARGLTWSLSECKMSLRRPDFPSWSWAGWRASGEATLQFTDVKVESAMPEQWGLDFYYYRLNESTSDYELTLVDKSNDPDLWGTTVKQRARMKLPSSSPSPTTDNPFAPPPKVAKDRPTIRTRNAVKSLPKTNGNWEDLPSPSEYMEDNPFAPKGLIYPSQVVVDEAQNPSLSKERPAGYNMENTTNEQQLPKPSARPILSKTRDSPTNTVYETDGIGDFGSTDSDESTDSSLKDATYIERSNNIETNWPTHRITSKVAASAVTRAGSSVSHKMERSMDAENLTDDVEVISARTEDLSPIPLNDASSENWIEDAANRTMTSGPSRMKRAEIKTKNLKTSPSLERFINEQLETEVMVIPYDDELSESPSSSPWTSSESLEPKHHTLSSLGPKPQYKTPRLLPEPRFEPRFSSRWLREPYRKWQLPGHPGESDHSKGELPPLQYDPNTMPPLLHILRFYTSVATLYIDPEPDVEYNPWGRYESDCTKPHNFYALRLPEHIQTSHEHDKQRFWGHAELPIDWDGKGKEAELLYISTSFDPPTDSRSIMYSPEPLNVILVEKVKGVNSEDAVYKKVTACGRVDMGMWRSAKPVWKLVNLA